MADAATETFASALKRTRLSYGLSTTKLARIVGRSRSLIEDWEEGVAIPHGRDLPRLQGAMPRLAPHMKLIPRSDSAPTESIPPRPFPVALQLARQQASLDQDALGELVGVTGQAVSAWETSRATPVQDHYERLVDLLPALREAEEPDWRAIPPPDGGKGTTRNGGNAHGSNGARRVVPLLAPWRERIAGVLTNAVERPIIEGILALAQDQDGALARLNGLIEIATRVRDAILADSVPTDSAPAPSPPVPAMNQPRPSVLVDLPGAIGAAARWGTALVRVEIARAIVHRLETELVTARAAEEDAVRDEEAARTEAQEAARREAGTLGSASA